MKSMIKKMMRSLWRMSDPVRQPLVRKIDGHALHLLRQLPQPPGPPADLDLVLNSVVRELARLRLQVEMLQQQIDELQPIDQDSAHSESRLSVVAEIG